jgi:Domain of unknown function (DUF4258)
MNGLLDFTNHAKTMMHERLIQEDWVYNTVNDPDTTEEKRDDEKHPRVITAFFDRRVQQ